MGVWDSYTNTCGDGICDNTDDCVGNNWNDGNCEPLGAEDPVAFSLKQNYPNPFNPTTTIEFSTESNDYVELVIYDILGKHIKTLVSGYLLNGEHKVNWDGTDNNGNTVTSGIYIYQLSSSQNIISKKMTLIR